VDAEHVVRTAQQKLLTVIIRAGDSSKAKDERALLECAKSESGFRKMQKVEREHDFITITSILCCKYVQVRE